MSTVIVLAPVIIGSWPTITAAVAGAAAAMGLIAANKAKQEVKAAAAVEAHAKVNQAEVVLAEDQEVAKNLAREEEMVLTKGDVTVRVRRDARGRCTVCAEAAGYSKAQLKAIAQEFTQHLTRCFVYNRVMSEVKMRGFQVVNEEQTEDETVRIHLRRWEA